jgi:hypothetical protein
MSGSFRVFFLCVCSEVLSGYESVFELFNFFFSPFFCFSRVAIWFLACWTVSLIFDLLFYVVLGFGLSPQFNFLNFLLNFKILFQFLISNDLFLL